MVRAGSFPRAQGASRLLLFLDFRPRPPLVFGFAHGRVGALLWLGVAERVAGRRERLAYALEDGALAALLVALVPTLFHGV